MRSFNEFITSSKSILFINFDYDVTDLDGVTTNIKEYLESKIDRCIFAKYTQIYYSKNNLYVNDTPLNEIALVFLGAVNQSYEMAATIQSYCELRNIPIIKYGETPENYNKLLELQKLSDNGIKTPKTIIGCAKYVNTDDAIEYLDLPIVSKITNGSQGKGVEINKTKEDLQKRITSFGTDTIILQEFIPNSCDYRVFFVGDDHIISMKRTRKKDNFKNNISLGGEGKEVDLKSDVFDMALKAHEAMNFFASGVDLIQNDDTKEWYCLEVNAAPQFGMWNVDKTLDVFIKYIEKYKL